MSIKDSFGKLDLPRLLSDSDGLISYRLFDSGTFRTGEYRYDFSLEKGDAVRIWPVANPSSKLLLNRFIQLTPQTIAFVGLYIGDGVKASRSGTTSVISVSQREPHLSGFIRNQFMQFFGESLTFTHRVNEDCLFFMTDNMRKALANLRRQLLKEGREDILTDSELQEYLARDLESVIEEQPSTMKVALRKYSGKHNLQKYQKYLVEFFANRPIMNEYLIRSKMAELEESGYPLSNRDTIKPNVRLPGVKGSREEGKSSRSDELDVDGLQHFHTLFLRILSDVLSSIVKNEQEVTVPGSTKPWIVWNGKPHDRGVLSLSTRSYVLQSGQCLRFSRNHPKRYVCVEETDVLALKMGSNLFKVPKTLTLTPLICLFVGLYLAEGHTPRWKLFDFSTKPVGSLNIAFTASEPDSLAVCLEAMKKLILGKEGIPQYWRIKVGTKYVPETVTVGNKLGAVALRRGEKGQGVASGFEIVEALRAWATRSLPALKEINMKFDHLEYTGAGIPRVDVFYHRGPEIYLFSLMHDLVSDPDTIDRYSSKSGGDSK